MGMRRNVSERKEWVKENLFVAWLPDWMLCYSLKQGMYAEKEVEEVENNQICISF